MTKINENLLKGAIAAKGMTQATLAKAINLTPSGLWRKMKNKNEFTLAEVRKIRDVLELPEDLLRAIFLL